MFFANRQELADYFESRMSKSYAELQADQRLRKDSNLVKTYLIEVHSKGKDKEFIESCLERTGIQNLTIRDCTETRDKELINIALRLGKEELYLYFVKSEPRFWLIHSFTRSKTMDNLIDKLTSCENGLDKLWLPIQLLEYLSRQGSFNGLGLKFDRRHFLSNGDIHADDEVTSFLKLQLWGNKAQRIYDILRDANNFPNETTLSKVKVKHRIIGSEDRFSINDIKYNGKLTARGSSFQSHLHMVYSINDMYSAAIKQIEDQYLIKFNCEAADQVDITGHPIQLTLSRPITDYRVFIGSIFNSAAPFRLMGQILEESPAYVLVSGVDLHVGGSFDFEVAGNSITMYLRPGCCGNTVVRILTNIQQYFDSLARLEGVHLG